MRRVLNRNLTLGWSAWLELWEAKTHAMDRLRQCGNRLHAPALANSFALWLADMRCAEREKEREEMELQANSIEVQVRKARHEASLLHKEEKQLKSEMGSLSSRIGDQTDACKSLRAELDALRRRELEREELAKAEEGVGSHGATDELDADEAANRKANEEMLQKLTQKQAFKFEEELNQLRHLGASREAQDQSVLQALDGRLNTNQKEVAESEEKLELLKVELAHLQREQAAGMEALKAELYNEVAIAQRELEREREVRSEVEVALKKQMDKQRLDLDNELKELQDTHLAQMEATKKEMQKVLLKEKEIEEGKRKSAMSPSPGKRSPSPSTTAGGVPPPVQVDDS
jgi:chromosome segregation ATPase